ncbi:MAG: HDOD domain-containing protein [Deltaproteobacteria bacterium]|nr:HDOD domain-containing protein [Deltaproteobacteria bacterium]
MNLVDQILNSTDRLPSFPMVIQRALQLIEDPRSSAQNLVDVLQFDQSITANILKLCNSAYFGLRKTVSSLREALVMVGFDQLMEIILSQESASFLQDSCKGYDLGQADLWKHSVACGLLSGIISKRLKREASLTLFTAALLHDIGKMVLGHYVQDYFRQIKNLAGEKQISFTEAEKEILGIDHAELGGKVAEKWKFPKSIISAIQYHHAPSLASEESEVVELVSLCDIVAMITGIGGGADGLAYHGNREVMKRYHLGEKDIEQFIVKLEDRFQLVNETLDTKRGGEGRLWLTMS